MPKLIACWEKGAKEFSWLIMRGKSDRQKLNENAFGSDAKRLRILISQAKSGQYIYLLYHTRICDVVHFHNRQFFLLSSLNCFSVSLIVILYMKAWRRRKCILRASYVFCWTVPWFPPRSPASRRDLQGSEETQLNGWIKVWLCFLYS